MATIAELLMEKGRRLGQARRESGNISANMWQGVGNAVAGGFERYQQERAQEPVRRAQALQLEGLEAEAETRTQQTKAAQRRAQAFEAGTALLAQGVRDPKQLLEATGDPELATKLLDATLGLERLGIGQKIADLYKQHGENLTEAHIRALGPEAWSYVKAFQDMAPKPQEGFTLSPGQQRFGPDGQPIASVAEAPKPVTFSAPQTAMVNGRRTLVRAGSDGQMYDTTGKKIDAPVMPDVPPSSGGNDEPLVSVVGPDGKPVLVRRSQAEGRTPASGTSRPASGLEKRALNFFNRARQADEDVEALETQIAQMGLAGQARMEFAPNFLQSDEGQLYRQAQRAFTEARLRKDSGAAIPQQEFTNDRQTYFAQPGDSQETLEQKRRARAAVLASLAFESGQAFTEFVGDETEAQRLLQSYKQRAERKDKDEGPMGPVTVGTGQITNPPKKMTPEDYIKKYGGG